MGLSVETQVEFVALGRYDVEYWMLHDGKRYEDDSTVSDITAKARKKLENAQPGDIIEVVWDYNAASYPIVQAKVITGSAEEQVKLLEARVAFLEDTLIGLPKAMRRAAAQYRGERWSEAQEVAMAMVVAVEALVLPISEKRPADADE